MARNITALFAGLIFGLGLVISQKVNPAKVIAFLDVFGDWDPSLAFVMGGALIVTAIGYRTAWQRAKPVLADRFQVPSSRQIDKRLAIGALLFGFGWGLVGLCPGPAIAAITIGGWDAALFLVMMSSGMVLFEALHKSTLLQST
ncbi:DUF6691 family protein [Henriciella sp.]|uniref:DUF6691 family protein n=1 Tax=Henriciella sp. TaxID=1968823 RepID=UPI0026364CA5|nr:DUF6691 family protein [Henriciella sp.]